jgi:hypothetical protein
MDNEKESYYNTLQLIMKIRLNSLYGKFGWSSEHDISNYITNDSSMLLKMFYEGNLDSIK